MNQFEELTYKFKLLNTWVELLLLLLSKVNCLSCDILKQFLFRKSAIQQKFQINLYSHLEFLNSSL